MLVLSRKRGEKIMIGEGITLSIVRVGANRVQIGIDAPADVEVRREGSRESRVGAAAPIAPPAE
jgi:carbon storage regulator